MKDYFEDHKPIHVTLPLHDINPIDEKTYAIKPIYEYLYKMNSTKIQ